MKKNGLPGSLADALVKKIIALCNPGRIVLYGSRARGTSKRTSDVDLAVSGCRNSYLLNQALNEELPSLLKFQVVNFDEVTPKLKKEIQKEGVLLYEKAGHSSSRIARGDKSAKRSGLGS